MISGWPGVVSRPRRGIGSPECAAVDADAVLFSTLNLGPVQTYVWVGVSGGPLIQE
jgi:hypothetical protein